LFTGSIHESIDEAAVTAMGGAVDKDKWLEYATNQVRTTRPLESAERTLVGRAIEKRKLVWMA